MADKDKPFIAWDFMAKEKSPDSEESIVSLELSLSPFSTTTSDKEKELHCKKFEHPMLYRCSTEKNSAAFPSDSSNAGTHADIQLELSLFDDQFTRELDERNVLRMEKSSGAFPPDTTNTDTNVDVPTELPLFVDYMSTGTTTRSLDAGDMLCTEKKSSGALSMEPIETETDLWLELSLSVNKPLGSEGREGSNQCQHILKPTDGFPSDKKRQTMKENRELSANRKKRSIETMRMGDHLSLGLGHGGDPDPWRIKKKLLYSDISHMSRLLLPKESVKSDILRHWNEHQLAQIEKGLKVSFLDCDTNTRYDEIVFKRWKNGAYVFIKEWTAIVEARELQINDEIGLYWDIPNLRFNFSVINRVGPSNLNSNVKRSRAESL